MRRKKLKRCSKTGKVVLATELDAKIVLAGRVARDKGEVRYYPCSGHWHLTSQHADSGVER